jgi:hypothetical protein
LKAYASIRGGFGDAGTVGLRITAVEREILRYA